MSRFDKLKAPSLSMGLSNGQAGSDTVHRIREP
jgi:hypothetical protein